MTAADTAIPKTYALISHGSAVEAIWALAARGWQGVLDDESIWLVPASERCVCTQKDVKRLQREVDLRSLGIYHDPIDLLVPDKVCCSRGRLARFHVWKGSFPEHSFVRVHERVFVSTPYFAVFQIAMAKRAGQLLRAEAEASAREDQRVRNELGIEGPGSTSEELLRWDNISRFVQATSALCDFMGTYRQVPIEPSGGGSRGTEIVYGKKPLVEPDAFAAYLRGMRKGRGVMRAREVGKAALSGSASPMETALALILTLPVQMGGFGISKPCLNREIPINQEDRELSSQETMVGDLCWPSKRLVVEYYGWEEHFGMGPRKVASDASRANSLVALGWTVLHVTFEQVRSIAGVTLLARQIAEVLGVNLQPPTELERIWRARLLAMLLPEMTLVG